jgi:hypothetical protein
MSGVVGSDIGNVLSYQLSVFSKARARVFLWLERIAGKEVKESEEVKRGSKGGKGDRGGRRRTVRGSSQREEHGGDREGWRKDNAEAQRARRFAEKSKKEKVKRLPQGQQRERRGNAEIGTQRKQGQRKADPSAPRPDAPESGAQKKIGPLRSG